MFRNISEQCDKKYGIQWHDINIVKMFPEISDIKAKSGLNYCPVVRKIYCFVVSEGCTNFK
jgi:hypothetical protein